MCGALTQVFARVFDHSKYSSKYSRIWFLWPESICSSQIPRQLLQILLRCSVVNIPSRVQTHAGRKTRTSSLYDRSPLANCRLALKARPRTWRGRHRPCRGISTLDHGHVSLRYIGVPRKRDRIPRGQGLPSKVMPTGGSGSRGVRVRPGGVTAAWLTDGYPHASVPVG